MTDDEQPSLSGSRGMLTSRSTTWLVVAIVACVVLLNVWNTFSSSSKAPSSPNWAGYVWPNAKAVQFVSASVTVPHLNCHATPNARSSAWVGVGGFGSGSTWPFPQAGINMDCIHGTQFNFTWCSHSSFEEDYVEPGDWVSESVYRQGSNWFCQVQDVTSGSDQVKKMNYSYHGTVATTEWIVEDPTLNLKKNTLAKLANFRTVTFRDLSMGPAKVALGKKNSSHELQMQGSSGPVEARPKWSGSELKVVFG